MTIIDNNTITTNNNHNNHDNHNSSSNNNNNNHINNTNNTPLLGKPNTLDFKHIGVKQIYDRLRVTTDRLRALCESY